MKTIDATTKIDAAGHRQSQERLSMTSLLLASLRVLVLIAVATPLMASAGNAAEPVIDKRLDQLIDGCVKFVVADPTKAKDGAEACEKVTNTLKTRAELQQKAVDWERTAQERVSFASFGWPGLILFDVVLIVMQVVMIWMTKGKSSELLKDPDGKLSFSRAIGLFGAAGIFIASALLLNVLLIHLYVFNRVPDGIVSLFAPILTFVPTLLPYVFAKREEGAIARARALGETTR